MNKIAAFLAGFALGDWDLLAGARQTKRLAQVQQIRDIYRLPAAKRALRKTRNRMARESRRRNRS